MESDRSNIPEPEIDSSLTLRRRMVLCWLLLAVTFAAYWPAQRNGFVNFDDPHYITENKHIQAGLTWQTVRWAATANYESNWHPLTWISHAADISLFGLRPAGHHTVSVLHALNAMLLFVILWQATKREWESFFVALLFALHPINVESVAWASERKNVLSMLFLLLALYAYGKYVQRRSPLSYGAVFVLFALGLAAKPQIITLPFLLLLWDFWPLQRWSPQTLGSGESTASESVWKLCAEKIPLFALSAASAVLTLRAQLSSGAVQMANNVRHAVAAYPFSVRLENAVVAYAQYVRLFFFPPAWHRCTHTPELISVGIAWQLAGSFWD